jgi:hypothetical protein
MISLHGGRLLLLCSRSDKTWHARVVLGPKPEHQIESDTGTVHLPDALGLPALADASSALWVGVARIKEKRRPLCGQV